MSPRILKFKEYVEHTNIEYKNHICLDVKTRLNSTYWMLDDAFKHKKGIDELGCHETKYVNELGKGSGVPSYEES